MARPLLTTPFPFTPPSTIHHHQHNLPQLISSTTSLPQLKQIHVHLIQNPQHHHHFFDLILSSLSFPAYALSLLSFIRPVPLRLSNQLLRNLSRSNTPHNTLIFFDKMMNNCFMLDRFSFPPLLKAASKCLGVVEGKVIHGMGIKLGVVSDPFVESSLVGMYANCGLISEARLVFDKMSHKDGVSWNIMIGGYCQSHLFDDVLSLLEEMKSCNTEPDVKVFTTILSACGSVGNLEVGKVVHGMISKDDLLTDSHLQSALLSMYANSGDMDAAKTVYEDLKTKDVIASTTMISGYSKASNIEAARLIFDEIVEKDLVCWSAMIACYAESDKPQEALNIFHDMHQHRITPDQVTMLSVVAACARLGALDQAKRIHQFIEHSSFRKALPINNALIDMYAKCGSLERAKETFNWIQRKNVISWTSIVRAFAVHGDVESALNYFERMKLENIEPNWITFVGVLYACSHAGLVEAGREIFDSMVNEYGIAPRLEHYGCMVDLYGRANRVRDALELIETMPMSPNVVVWGSLMAACRIHGETELGEFAAKRLLELEPNHDGAHVFLSNIYAKQKNWGSVGMLRNVMKRKGIVKERATSMIEMDNKIHEFLTADKYHKRSDEIYAKLDEVVEKLKQVGYSPNTNSVLVDLEEDEKQDVVLWHSEKLALCYGLISKEKVSCIRIIKNLRICDDCHSFMKFASNVLNTEIVIRDRSRFHHCKHGLCSCKDYW